MGFCVLRIDLTAAPKVELDVFWPAGDGGGVVWRYSDGFVVKLDQTAMMATSKLMVDGRC
jgi:hypothetical protein